MTVPVAALTAGASAVISVGDTLVTEEAAPLTSTVSPAAKSLAADHDRAACERKPRWRNGFERVEQARPVVEVRPTIPAAASANATRTLLVFIGFAR